jgi:CRP-like cAMP-binding protein
MTTAAGGPAPFGALLKRVRRDAGLTPAPPRPRAAVVSVTGGRGEREGKGRGTLGDAGPWCAPRGGVVSESGAGPRGGGQDAGSGWGSGWGSGKGGVRDMRLADLADVRAREGNAALARALRRVPLFRDLPQADALAVFDCLSEAEVGAGAVLCRRGDAGDRAYVIEAGEAEARLGLGPRGVALRRLGPGDVVGEMSLVTGQPRSADVVALTDAVLWVLDEADFRALTAGSAPLLRALTRTLAGRMAENAARLDQLPGRPGPATDGTGRGAAPGAAEGAGGAGGASGRETEAPSPLSRREQEVAVLVAQGLTNREIAAGLVVTVRTAATHLEHILGKLDLRSRAQVAVWAAERGLLARPNAPGAPGTPRRLVSPTPGRP